MVALFIGRVHLPFHLYEELANFFRFKTLVWMNHTKTSMQNAVYCFGIVSASVRHIGKKFFQSLLQT